MTSFRKISQRSSGAFYRFAACPIVRFLPARLWYSAAHRATRIQIKVLRPLALVGLYPYRRDIRRWEMRRKIIAARLMDQWLKRISAFHRPFPIPFRTRGAAELEELLRQGTGLVGCSFHIFLADVVLRDLAEKCQGDLSVITRLPNGANGYPIWGAGKSIPAIAANEGPLLKVRSILRRGGSVAVLLDRGIGAPLHSNILHLARAFGTRAAFGFPDLLPNGDILIDYFVLPPFTSDDSIRLGLETLRYERDRLLQISDSKVRPSAPVPVA